MLATASFHHVGVVIEKIEPAMNVWLALGYHQTIRVSDPIQKADIVLLERAGNATIELVCPLAPDSPASSWLKRSKGGPYHTCFEIDELAAATTELTRLGFTVVMEPVPAVAFANRRVSFLWSKDAGLLELLERGR